MTNAIKIKSKNSNRILTLKKDVHAPLGKAGNSKFRAAYMAWMEEGFTHTINNMEIGNKAIRRFGQALVKIEGDYLAFHIPSNRKINNLRARGLLEGTCNINGHVKLENLVKGMKNLCIRPDRISVRYANEALKSFGAEVQTYSTGSHPGGDRGCQQPSLAYLVKADGSRIEIEFDKTYRIPLAGTKIPANIINL